MPKDIGAAFYKAELDRPIRYKREVDHVTKVEECVYKEGYATVDYWDTQGSWDSSKPIKIYYRKRDKSPYVKFDGKTYNVEYRIVNHMSVKISDIENQNE